MKGSWGITLALCGVLVVAALVVHSVGRDAAPRTGSEVTGGERRMVEDRAAAGMRGGAGAPLRGGPSDGAAANGATTANSAGALSRRRLPEALAGAARGDGVRRGNADAERDDVDGNGDADDAPREGQLAHHELPPAGAAGAQNAPAVAAEGDAAPVAPADVLYDGAGQVFDTGSRVQVGDAGAITGNAGTISFWANPEWDSGNLDHANFVQLGDNGLRVVKDGENLRFEYTDGNGDNALGGVVNISDWQAGDWRYVTATWQGGTLSLYLDGQQVFVSNPGVPPPLQNNPRLYVGSTEATNGGVVAPAQLSFLTLMNRTLSSDEIRTLFQSGPRPKQ